MAFVLLKRAALSKPAANSLLLSLQCRKFSTSRASPFLGRLSPLFPETSEDGMKDCRIEVVDDATWHVSSGLMEAWRGENEEKALEMMRDVEHGGGGDANGAVCSVVSHEDDPDFDDIEDMRIRGNLYYKVDKDSREFEEYKFDFHGRKFARNERDRKESKVNKTIESAKSYKLASKVEMISTKDTPTEMKEKMKKKDRKESKEKKKKKKENPSHTVTSTSKDTPREIKIKKTNKESEGELLLGYDEDKTLFYRLNEMGDSCVGKKQRTLTFNQQTAPYHEPFCLDIYISSGSVRACIIHRATSKVVVVSHSISKDMKFDLGSTKNRSACAAVGKVLAQSALADDIHNVVYTPRKGDRVEGRIQVVLEAISDGGVDVKVKLKQKKWRGVRPGNPDQQ